MLLSESADLLLDLTGESGFPCPDLLLSGAAQEVTSELWCYVHVQHGMGMNFSHDAITVISGISSFTRIVSENSG